MTRILAFILAIFILAGCFGGEVKEPYRLLSPNECGILLKDDPTALLVDVRTPAEYRSGFIQGAINLPLDEMETKIKKQLPLKDQLIIIYCKTGKRSTVAVEDLLELGYTNLVEMDGGVSAWKGMLATPPESK